jgi:hypothetical protein
VINCTYKELIRSGLTVGEALTWGLVTWKFAALIYERQFGSRPDWSELAP